MLKLTRNQKAGLESLAQKNGMRLLISRTQVGIGYAGQFAFEVVYTKGRTRILDFWKLRIRVDNTEALAREMRTIIYG